MNCSDARENLSAFLDGELDRKSAAVVESHLAECGACRAELESLRGLVGTLHAMPKRHAPADVERAVVSQLERDALFAKPAAPRRRRTWAVIFGSTAAAALLVAAVGIYIVRHGAPARTETPAGTSLALGAEFRKGSKEDSNDDSQPTGTTGGTEFYAHKMAGASGPSSAKPDTTSATTNVESGGVTALKTVGGGEVAVQPSTPAPTPMKLGKVGDGDGPWAEPKGPAQTDVQVAARPEVFELELSATDVDAARTRINTIATSLNIRAVDSAPVAFDVDGDQRLGDNNKTQKKDLPQRLADANEKQKQRRQANDDGRVREAMSKIAQNAHTEDEYEATVRRLLDLVDTVDEEPSPAPVMVLAVPEEQLPDLVAKLHADQAANEKDKANLGRLAPVTQNKIPSPPAPRVAPPRPSEMNNDTKPVQVKKAPDPLDDFLKALDEAAKEDAEREKMAQDTAGREGEPGRIGQKHIGRTTREVPAKSQTQVKPENAPAEGTKRNDVAQQAQPAPAHPAQQGLQNTNARRMVYLQIYLNQALPNASNVTPNAQQK